MPGLSRDRIEQLHKRMLELRDSSGRYRGSQAELGAIVSPPLRQNLVSYAISRLVQWGLVKKLSRSVYEVYETPQELPAAGTVEEQIQLLREIRDLLAQDSCMRKAVSHELYDAPVSAKAAASVPHQDPEGIKRVKFVSGVPAGFPQPLQTRDIPQDLWPWPERDAVREFFACDQDGAIWSLSLGKEVPAGIWVPVMEGFSPAKAAYAKGGLYHDAGGLIVGQQTVYQDACRLWQQNPQSFMNFVCHIKREHKYEL